MFYFEWMSTYFSSGKRHSETPLPLTWSSSSTTLNAERTIPDCFDSLERLWSDVILLPHIFNCLPHFRQFFPSFFLFQRADELESIKSIFEWTCWWNRKSRKRELETFCFSRTNEFLCWWRLSCVLLVVDDFLLFHSQRTLKHETNRVESKKRTGTENWSNETLQLVREKSCTISSNATPSTAIFSTSNFLIETSNFSGHSLANSLLSSLASFRFAFHTSRVTIKKVNGSRQKQQKRSNWLNVIFILPISSASSNLSNLFFGSPLLQFSSLTDHTKTCRKTREKSAYKLSVMNDRTFLISIIYFKILQHLHYHRWIRDEKCQHHLALPMHVICTYRRVINFNFSLITWQFSALQCAQHECNFRVRSTMFLNVKKIDRHVQSKAITSLIIQASANVFKIIFVFSCCLMCYVHFLSIFYTRNAYMMRTNATHILNSDYLHSVWKTQHAENIANNDELEQRAIYVILGMRNCSSVENWSSH